MRTPPTGLDRLVARAETMKLAQLLGVDSGELEYLHDCSPESLVLLRLQTTDALFDGEAGVLKRVADASGLLPIGLVATIAEKGMGSLLCGRLAGMLPPERAVEVAVRLKPEFLAEVATQTDPRRAIAVISKIPAESAAGVARILNGQRAFVAMGRFVAYLDDDALRACIDELDDEALIRTSYTLEGKERLDRVITLVSDERIKQVPATATKQHLWPEVIDLIAHLGPEQRARVTRVCGPKAEQRALEEAARLDVKLN
jgi:hypothetical protein